jgi:heme/copper-type cytochrome/quinol oxidase subunit 4
MNILSYLIGDGGWAMANIDLSPMAFESMFLLAFAAVALFTGLFTAYFGVKKSRAVGIILILIGIVVLLAFYYFIWLGEEKRLIAITGSAVFGAFIGFLASVGVFLLVIMKSEPSEKKVEEPTEEIKAEERPSEEVTEIKEEVPSVKAEEEAKPPEEVKEEAPAPLAKVEEEVKEELPTPLPEEEVKPTEEVKEEVKEEAPAPSVETEEKPIEREEEKEAEEEPEKKRKGGRKKGGKKGRR